MEVVVMRPIVIGTQYGAEALARAFMDDLLKISDFLNHDDDDDDDSSSGPQTRK